MLMVHNSLGGQWTLAEHSVGYTTTDMKKKKEPIQAMIKKSDD